MDNTRRRSQASRIYTALGLCVSVVSLAGLAHCGGDGLEAPYTPYPERCPDVDTYLAPVLELASQGRLPHLSDVVSEELSEQEREGAVALVFDLLGALDLEASSASGADFVSAASIHDLELGLAGFTGWLGVAGPDAPYLDVLGCAEVALATEPCKGEELFYLLSELVRQERLLLAFSAAISDPSLDLIALLDDLEAPDDDPRAGLRELARSLLTSGLKPDFKVRDWTGLLGLILDVDAPTWSSLIAELEAFFVEGPNLLALQSLLQCFDESDPNLRTSDLLYDVLTEPPVVEGQRQGREEAITPPELRGSLLSVLSLFLNDAGARETLSNLASAMLTRERVEGVLADLTLLFEAGVMGPVLELFRAVSTRSCEP